MADRTLNINVVVKGGNTAKRSLGDIGGGLNDIKSKGDLASSALLGMVARIGGITGIALAIKRVAGEAISMNAKLETASKQFEALGFTAQGAEDHVRGLFTFAQRTPFETAPIIEASRLLQTLGGNALNTSENLTLVGNAAAATSQPIESVAFWVGRMVAQLQSGSVAIGESTARLLEMGAITGEGRAKLEDLAKSGRGTEVVFAELARQFGEFGDAMEEQSQTFQGLFSTMTDNVSILIQKVGEPLFDLSKVGLTLLNERLDDLNDKVTAAKRVGGLFTETLKGNRRAALDLASSLGMTSRKFNELEEGARLADQKVRSLEASIKGPQALTGALTSAGDAMKEFEKDEKRITEETKKLRKEADEQAAAAKRAEEANQRWRDSIEQYGNVAQNSIFSITMLRGAINRLKDTTDAEARAMNILHGRVLESDGGFIQLDRTLNSRVHPTVERTKLKFEVLGDTMREKIDGGLSKFREFNSFLTAVGMPGINDSILGNIAAWTNWSLSLFDVFSAIINKWGSVVSSFMAGFSTIGRILGAVGGAIGLPGAILAGIGFGLSFLFRDHPEGRPAEPVGGLPDVPYDEGGAPGDPGIQQPGDLPASFPHGGLVMGRGGHRAIMAEPGEFVLRRDAVRRIGLTGAARLNAGLAGAGGPTVNVSVNVHGGFLDSPSSQRALSKLVEEQIMKSVSRVRRVNLAR